MTSKVARSICRRLCELFRTGLSSGDYLGAKNAAGATTRQRRRTASLAATVLRSMEKMGSCSHDAHMS